MIKVIIAIIVGIIVYNIFGGVGLLITVALIVIGGIVGSGGSSSSGSSIGSSSSSYSSSSSISAYMESRKNDPHTCSNCGKYSSINGVCRLNGDPKSAGDSCFNWR